MRFYSLLLHLYPASFRVEYGLELRQLCRARRREVADGLPAAWFWLNEAVDVFASALQVHGDLLVQDVAYTLRGLARAPGFAATVVLVTALGVGANTAVFSVADRVLIRPLPFPGSERLVKLWENVPEYSRMELSPANYRDWKRSTRSFESMGAYNPVSVNLVGEGEPQRLAAAQISADLLPTLGVEPALGRGFSAEDDAQDAPGTLVISHALWQSSFAGGPGAVGREVRLDGETYVVIGVMPEGFSFPSREVRLWKPLRLGGDDFEDRNNNYLEVVARLAAGATPESAREELRLVTEALEREYPDENAQTRATIVLLRDEVSDQARLLLAALAGASLCVLLLACTNLASLLMARAVRRRRELAVRSALGAGRERLVRQLLTESLVLAGLGGGLGVLVAVAMTPLLASLVPTTLPIDGAGAVDATVLAAALLLSLATGLGFGVVPAFRGGAQAGAGGLHETGRSALAGRSQRMRSWLVVAELAISVVLVVAAGLLIRALGRVESTDPGFRTEGVLTLTTPLPQSQYAPTRLRARFYDDVVAQVEALPGVARAAFTSFAPLTMQGGIWPVVVPDSDADHPPTACLRFVTPGFFDTLGIPLRRGRDVEAGDGPDTPFVAVVSASFAQRHWPGQDPIGRRFEFAFFERTVVGVVGDIRFRGLERRSEPQVYLPYRQVPDGGVFFYAPKDLVVRTAGDPVRLVPAIRDIVRREDPELPVAGVRRLADVVAGETASRRTQLWVLGTFAALASLLAGLGIHGLLAYVVSQRVPEIGLRMALGAEPGRILRLVLGDGLVLAGRGAVLGLGLAYLAARSLESLLAGLSALDPLVFAAAAALAVVTTLSGAFPPALRALRTDPTTALRADS